MKPLEDMTWKELEQLLYETQETHDNKLRKRIKDEINKRHKYM
jgi:hypothetical protein